MILRTVSDLVRLDHGLRAYCDPCRRYVDIDLEALIRDGRGELPYRAVRFRCTQCGGIGGMQLVATAPFRRPSAPVSQVLIS